MLVIQNLNKNYGKFKAVNNLNLYVPKGEIFGFVGPNGAGKTTTMRITAGLLSATSGNVLINDIDIFKNPLKSKEHLGYMPDFFGVYDNLKAIEYLEFYASIYGITGSNCKKVINDLLELVNLSDKASFYVDHLSRGMKQRLCLARALVHNPDLLILDEPASGMDPRARAEMKSILIKLKDMGKTVLISSHILSELSTLCTSIGIVNNGSLVTQGHVSDVIDKVYKNKTIEIKLLDNTDISKAIRYLKEFPEISNITEKTNIVEAKFSGDDAIMHEVLKSLITKDISVISFKKIDGNLEDVFLKVTG